MERVVEIDGRAVRMRASALIPRIYRAKFGRDLIIDMRALERKYRAQIEASKNQDPEALEDAQFSIIDLTVFENIAYCMALNGGEKMPHTPDEWLDQFEMFSIYEILPVMMELWAISNQTTAEPRKNHR